MIQPTPPPSKRQDLQGIRGLAILSVLGFHFYPFYFPNGYLGVDQFFVLSEIEKVILVDDFSDEEGEEDVELVSVPPKPSTYIGPFSKYCFLIPMAFVVTYPIEMFPFLVRPVFTCFTGLLMLVSVDDDFLSNKVLTYIGDISYSLYLIHWPIYAYTKLTFENNPYALGGGLLISMILAVIVYETYEKWYLKLSNTTCALLIVFLFLINVVLINKDAIQDMNFMNEMGGNSLNSTKETFPRLDGVTQNMTFDDATRLNKMWNKFDIEMMIEPGCIQRTPQHSRWCDYELKGDEYKIAIFGNSYTKNHHKMFVQECKNRAYNITMDSERGCEPLAASPNDHSCVKKLSEFVEFMDSSKPDYAFIFTRFFAVGDPFKDNNSSDLEHDRTFNEMKSQLNKFLPNIKKKLYILDSFPRANAAYISRVAADLKNGKKIEDISKTLLRPDGYERGRIRHAALVKECGDKCELIDYLPLFWKNSTNMYQYFDERGFSYFTSPNHLSAHGIELVRPIYNKICASL
ncbi:hypothetical protein CRE_24312 [Caenorhabditis remanei]|uniref:Uncharacterized protein n=1 Tax=Caenorhabditis remanei TaxID=31234 RepID=E3NPN5_CAERE|nr:hypothetical protein CRE_24312 [Caenorhabditis remanei]